jgi:pimeloyl-ACP methyl ester carboxylesterase
VVWGENDEIFVGAGAAPYKRDNPAAEVHMLDTGHFALETHGAEIAALMRDFLDRNVR